MPQRWLVLLDRLENEERSTSKVSQDNLPNAFSLFCGNYSRAILRAHLSVIIQKRDRSVAVPQLARNHGLIGKV